MLLSLLSKRTLRADFRDAYGFTVRPQYLETFNEFNRIYKSEEKERSTKWRVFLQQQEELGQTNSSIEEDVVKADADVTANETKHIPESVEEENVNVASDDTPRNDDNQTDNAPEKVASETPKVKKPVVENWAEVRLSLSNIENMMCRRVKHEPKNDHEKQLHTIHEGGPTGEDSNEESNDNEQPNSTESSDEVESLFPWKELESLVRGGVPRDLRGEVLDCTSSIVLHFSILISYYMKYFIVSGMASFCRGESTKGGELLPEFVGCK
ncbi:uncharacterized protein LOC143611252 [Bidens hawaiensis]|uniref:uncharacterized protein LOC143611252 n=1 Tax=Bidens hawaiensis TaxID=980011 RepID=UPI00404A4E52